MKKGSRKEFCVRGHRRTPESVDPKSGSCLICCKERKRLYYLANKEKINTRNLTWHAENKEQDDTTKGRYYDEHREEISEHRRVKFKEKDPEARKKTGQKYRETHKEEIRQYSVDYWNAHPEKMLFQNARTRAKAKGVPFSIDESDVFIPPVCPILGTPFQRGVPGDCEFAPSLDRVRPHLGYIKGNVAVISRKANTLKSYGTVEEHEKIVAWMKKQLLQDQTTFVATETPTTSSK
jgi:hypothetical protein